MVDETPLRQATALAFSTFPDTKQVTDAIQPAIKEITLLQSQLDAVKAENIRLQSLQKTIDETQLALGPPIAEGPAEQAHRLRLQLDGLNADNASLKMQLEGGEVCETCGKIFPNVNAAVKLALAEHGIK